MRLASLARIGELARRLRKPLWQRRLGKVVSHKFISTLLVRCGRGPFDQNFPKFRSKSQWIGSVQPEKFHKKTGPPQKVDHFGRYDRSEFWLYESPPHIHVCVWNCLGWNSYVKHRGMTSSLRMRTARVEIATLRVDDRAKERKKGERRKG